MLYDNGMKIVIIGAGFTGTRLARKLIGEKNDVILIDNDEAIVRHASNHLDCTVLFSEGNSMQTLEEAGIATADALVTLTESDEVNMITCSLVDAVYPDPLKIARVRNYAYYADTVATTREHADTLSRNHRPLYGIDHMIHPDVEAAGAIVRAIEHGAAVSEAIPLGDDFELSAVTIEEGSRLDGLPLKKIKSATGGFPLVVVYLETETGASLANGETILRVGNRVGVLTRNEDVPQLFALCNTKVNSIRKIAILGAERIGRIVADRLVGEQAPSSFGKLFGETTLRKLLGRYSRPLSHDLIVIDDDERRCAEASERYPDAKILLGDVTDEGLIQEENLDNCDLVIATTHNYDKNLVAAAYLESLGVRKTIVLTADTAFGEIAHKLGVEVAVPMRDTVVDNIMSHLHGKNVTAIHTIADGEYAIVECDVAAGSKSDGKTLREVSRPGEFLVLLAKAPDSGSYGIPNGETRLVPGMHLVLAAQEGDQAIFELFSEEA